jgi:hypothetical protein
VSLWMGPMGAGLFNDPAPWLAPRLLGVLLMAIVGLIGNLCIWRGFGFAVRGVRMGSARFERSFTEGAF